MKRAIVSKVDKTGSEKMNVHDKLKNKGYSNKQIEDIINHQFFDENKATIDEVFDFFSFYLIPIQVIINNTAKSPSILNKTTQELNALTLYFVNNFNYEYDEMAVIYKRYLRIAANSLDSIHSKINDLIKYGLSKESLRKIIYDNPLILATSLNKIKNLEKKFKDNGINKQNYLAILERDSTFLESASETIDERLKILRKIFGNDERYRKFLTLFPKILENVPETLYLKFNIYKLTGSTNIIMANPYSTIRSAAAVYARYNAIKDKENWNRKHLFYKNNEFYEKYHLKTEELINQYPIPEGFFKNVRF